MDTHIYVCIHTQDKYAEKDKILSYFGKVNELILKYIQKGKERTKMQETQDLISILNIKPQ